MTSTFRERYGLPDVLSVRDVPRPEPAAGQVLIRVHASTVNRTDCAALSGSPFIFRFFVGFPRPRPATGSDFAGEIVAVGEGVTRFRAGDRVWGFRDAGAGSHAQFITFPAAGPIALMPVGVPYDVAAASLEGPHYAINFLNKVKLTAGQRVLVNGATGGIGSAAVQLLKRHGVHVTAVCAPGHADRIEALGADRVIEYTRVDFTREDAQYDFVFDAVGKSTFGRCRRVLAPRGIYLSSELGPWGQNLLFALFTPLGRGRKVVFPLPVDVNATLTLMTTLLETGGYTPLIDRRYPLENIREAFTFVASGQKIGNVVIEME
ncbi:MAG: NAD(P)-dependent alcohol dehydrogenase [Acidobacteria bacterium]|nr:NAD(P)-dependent alcohol dehydrogenase [Acidobacteriota bacterium]